MRSYEIKELEFGSFGYSGKKVIIISLGGLEPSNVLGFHCSDTILSKSKGENFSPSFQRFSSIVNGPIAFRFVMRQSYHDRRV